MQKITLEEFHRFKSEFDELYNLIMDASKDKAEMFFSDGSLYDEEEAEKRMLDINDRLLNYDLSDIPAEDFGTMLMFATSFFKGLKGTGAHIDFSLFGEDWGFVELGDVRGCTLVNPDFSSLSFNDRIVDEKTREEYSEYFLERPNEIDNPKNEAIDRYYAREMTIEDVILLRDELSYGNKIIYISDRYKQIIDKVGFDRLAELWSREPIYMESFILDRYDFLKYLEVVTEEMTVDDIINTWFSITRKEIEDSGIHKLTRSKSVPIGADIIDIDVSLYGENFINQNPEFFVEDRSLPDEIKQKFYNGKLSFDEFFQYREEFEGVMAGIGIEDKSNLCWQLGRKKFAELIDIDAEAVFFLQDAEQHDKYIVKAFLEMENYESESLKGAIENLLRTYKVAVFNNDIDIKSIYGNKFLRDRLPELFLDEEAPDALKEAFYGRSLKIEDLNINPDWIQWLEGKKDYVKRCCIKKDVYDDWKTDFQMGDYSSEVEEYMLYMYEEELRVDRKKGKYLSDRILEGEFKTNNPDLFFEDLPEDLQKLFEERNLDMQGVFDLPKEQKELLRDKELSMLLNFYLGDFEFCQKVSGTYEAFELYEKYREVIEIGRASMGEGVDLPGDLCRFQIIYKIPYPDWGDKQIYERSSIDMEWYDFKTCLNLVQTHGRGMRYDSDYCTTYVIDSRFTSYVRSNRANRYLPDTFKEAIEEYTVDSAEKQNLMKIGDAYIENGEFEKGFYFFRRLLKNDLFINDDYPYLNLSRVYREANLYEQEIQIIMQFMNSGIKSKNMDYFKERLNELADNAKAKSLIQAPTSISVPSSQPHLITFSPDLSGSGKKHGSLSWCCGT